MNNTKQAALPESVAGQLWPFGSVRSILVEVGVSKEHGVAWSYEYRDHLGLHRRGGFPGPLVALANALHDIERFASAPIRESEVACG